MDETSFGSTSAGVVTRFAPSPTGFIHIGNMRAALWNYCFAKQHQGTFILRIEDTDGVRSEDRFTQALIEDLSHFGIVPDVIYHQSQRTALYEAALQRLLSSSDAYPCFCTDEALTERRKQQVEVGVAPRYDRRCADLNREERQKRLQAGMPHCIRFSVPLQLKNISHDIVYGSRPILSKEVGDFVIRRSDGSFPFLFTNLVDDALMGVTHVLRGQDHLSNTARQFWVQKALGYPIPNYGHFPLIVGENGQPLSKRHRHAGVSSSLEEGVHPAALTNYLLRLGCTIASNNLLSLSEAVKAFDLTRVSRSPACFEESQLAHWQKIALAALSSSEHYEYAKAVLKPHRTEAEVAWMREGALWFEDLIKQEAAFDSAADPTAPEVIQVLSAETDAFFEANLQALTHDNKDYQDVIQVLGAALGRRGRSLFLPIRALWTLQTHGNDLSRFFEVAGASFIRGRVARLYGWVKAQRDSSESSE